MKHTPGPWFYISGAVYQRPADADDPTRTAIAMRCSQKSKNLAECFDPCEKDANMKLIAAAPSLLEALETLTVIVGLTAIKYETQKEVLQEAYNIAIAAIKTAKGAK